MRHVYVYFVLGVFVRRKTDHQKLRPVWNCSGPFFLSVFLYQFRMLSVGNVVQMGHSPWYIHESDVLGFLIDYCDRSTMCTLYPHDFPIYWTSSSVSSTPRFCLKLRWIVRLKSVVRDLVTQSVFFLMFLDFLYTFLRIGVVPGSLPHRFFLYEFMNISHVVGKIFPLNTHRWFTFDT